MSDQVEELRATGKYSKFPIPTMHLDCGVGDALMKLAAGTQSPGMRDYLKTYVSCTAW